MTSFDIVLFLNDFHLRRFVSDILGDWMERSLQHMPMFGLVRKVQDKSPFLSISVLSF
jgi:hypothetical protein